MNNLQSCYQDLFSQHGGALFHSPPAVDLPEPLKYALTEYQIFEHLADSEFIGCVSVPPGLPICIPAGSFKLVQAFCRQGVSSLISSVFIEHPGAGDRQLPADLLIPCDLVALGDGIVHVPLVNIGTQDRWLQPHTFLGRLQMVSICPSNRSVSFCEEEIVPGFTVFIQSAVAGNHTIPGFDELSWSNL